MIHDFDDEIRSVTTQGDFKHFLHLYTKEVDKYQLQREFLLSIKPDKLIVTSSESDAINGNLGSIDANLVILEPMEFVQIEDKIAGDDRTALVVDAGSFPDQSEDACIRRERNIVKMGNSYLGENMLGCLCMYDISGLSKELLTRLVDFHTQYKLTTNDITFVSGDRMDSSAISRDSIKKIVKDNLEAIILALLHREPMCGADIISIIHREFNILLSPGTIYPLLHSLDEEGLVTWVKDGKEKRYLPIKDAYSKVRDRINENIRAKKWFTKYIQRELGLREDSHHFESQLRCGG